MALSSFLFVNTIKTPLLSSLFGTLEMNPAFSIDLRVLPKLVDSSPIFGPREVEGVPLFGFKFNNTTA